MATAKTARGSWLRLCEFTETRGGRESFFSLARFPDISPQDDDELHVVTSGDTPDKLAFMFYDDPRLWWVLAVANGWDQPLTSLVPGVEIVVPSARYVRLELVR